MLTDLQLIGMARGVSAGMTYLSAMNFVHRVRSNDISLVQCKSSIYRCKICVVETCSLEVPSFRYLPDSVN